MKKLLVIIILIIALQGLADSETRGLTCRQLAAPQNPDKVYAKPWAGSYTPETQQNFSQNLLREGWELADSVHINTFLKAQEHIGIEFSGINNQINVTSSNSGLIPSALDAVDRAPAWIQAELATTLELLDDDVQQIWADLINQVDDPIIDEVAFCIATASSQYLSSQWAYPELYVQNAELIYEYDAELGYVEVIDYGNSINDPDYYSTTRYWSKTASGLVHQVEVPREVYYWHIVHPKITDEIPAFINPALTESNSTHDNNIVTPQEGYFWRDFLYNYADEGYPLLRNYLTQCLYANDFTTGYESAIGACTQWLAQSLVFTSNYERPHQPVRIYRKHIGRCGEHADMRVALGRIALIPMTSIVCFTVDHTWNEFWDDEWIHWDGGSINNFYMYEQGWGSNFGSVIDVRSDGLMTPVTHKYAPSYADLTVHAIDAAGAPIDGARVLIGLSLNGQVSGDMVGWTDNHGLYHFPIGDGHQYWVSMSTQWGNLDYQLITENTVGGEVYDIELQIAGTIPAIDCTSIDIPDDDGEDYRLVVEYDSPQQVIYGNIVMDDTSEDTWFYERRANGALNFFMCDLVQYFSYTSDLAFEAFNCASESEFGLYGFDMPYPALGSWYAVIDNGNNHINPQLVQGYAALYRWEGQGGTAVLSGSVTDAFSGQPLAEATISAGAFSTVSLSDGSFSLDVYPGSYTVICDHPLYERMRYPDIDLEDGDSYLLEAQLTDDPIRPLNLMASGSDTEAAYISWDPPQSLMNRTLTGYWVYRFLAEDEFIEDNWVQLTGAPISETEFTDSSWLALPAGLYRYAVCAQYSQAFSDFSITTDLPLYMTAELQIMLNTNSGDLPAGAVISLTNTDEVNSPHNYEALYPQEGSLVLPEIWKGNYDIEISLEHFATLTDSICLSQNTLAEYELVELLPAPGFAGVYDYYLSWDAVPRNREFIEYKIYLDGNTQELAAVNNPGFDLEAAGVDDEQHSIEIIAVYSSGLSAPAQIEFLQGSSLNHELMASFDLDQDFDDSINGWTGNSSTVQLVQTPFGNGAQFNGADFITIAANEQLTQSALHYTTLFWIKADTLNTGWRGITGRPGRNQCVWLNASSSYLHHRFHTAGGGTNDGAPNTPDGSFHWQQWNLVAIVNDGNRAKTYINGELLADGYLNSALVADSTDMYIGKSPDSPTAEGYLYGIVDELRMWNRALSDLELREIYLAETQVLGYGTLCGTVSNAATGNGLENVIIQAGIFSSVTDPLGNYEIILPARTYDVSFSLDNYLIQYEDDFNVMANEQNILDFSFQLTGDSPDDIPAARLYACCYPNPFYAHTSSRTQINFEVNWQGKDNCYAELAIYNPKGQKVMKKNLLLNTGENLISWNSEDSSPQLPAGVYLYQINCQKYNSSGKILLLK